MIPRVGPSIAFWGDFEDHAGSPILQTSDADTSESRDVGLKAIPVAGRVQSAFDA